MSSNFHNLRGMHLNGIEPHEYMALGASPEAPPIVIPMHIHASGQYFFLTQPAKKKEANNVTAERLAMLQQGHDFYLIPHMFVPVPLPHPIAEAAQLIKVIATSGSKCQMAVPSVTSGGGALACCITNMLSANQNCADPLDVEVNVVLNLNSVETTPTIGDYAAAGASGLVDKVIGAVFGAGAKKIGDKLPAIPLLEDQLKQLWRRAPDELKFLETPTTKTTEWVKQLVDGDAS